MVRKVSEVALALQGWVLWARSAPGGVAAVSVAAGHGQRASSGKFSERDSQLQFASILKRGKSLFWACVLTLGDDWCLS